ncbi:uncharacterized protein AMSG_11619 [Thecamonas trahens ATCC 50062]|uniref:PDEase domain-containing protein n=1 Tax=Thecamonas trahens ATCC 50062 TaxID=461836 RepID=A0A0L0DEC7_THETB|nr:hypothetical protein AMSG_11619 [Thecamonas trahens ATCC 50062]KNC50649.1 hypothetical protein AMSG_11619 [Thecamonas trahens ATCC 50062]|eukprot:XP_013762598.1 hypothetical protein AMSG_11619 [Thecamonas trahens ATCC 50062]
MHRHVEFMSRFSITLGLSMPGARAVPPAADRAKPHPNGMRPTGSSAREALLTRLRGDDKLLRLALAMLVKLTPFSFVARPAPLSKVWAHRFTCEQFSQGRKEAALGIAVSPFMDGKSTSVTKGLTSIARIVVKPMFQAWVAAFGGIELTSNVNAFLTTWLTKLPEVAAAEHDAAVAAMTAYDTAYFRPRFVESLLSYAGDVHDPELISAMPLVDDRLDIADDVCAFSEPALTTACQEEDS